MMIYFYGNYFPHFLVQEYASIRKATTRRAKVEGSGTAVIVSLSGPPGIGWMVTLAPMPRVNVPWLIDAAVRLAPLSTCVIPLPEISPTTCVRSATSKVANAAV